MSWKDRPASGGEYVRGHTLQRCFAQGGARMGVLRVLPHVVRLFFEAMMRVIDRVNPGYAD